MVNSGATRKYLLYAVGEILLVMIGILLALQVNNWNDRARDEEFFVEMLREIKIDLKRDTFRFKRAVGYVNESIQEKRWGLTRTSFNISQLDSIRAYLNPHTFEFEITDDGFRRLVNSNIQVPDQYQEIYKELDAFYNVRQNGHIELLTLDEEETSFYNQYILNQSGFEIDIRRGIPVLQDAQERFEKMKSFLLDPQTRNYLKVFLVIKQSIHDQFKEIEEASVSLLANVNKVLGE